MPVVISGFSIMELSIDLALIGDLTDGLFGVGGILRYLYKYVQVDGLQPRVLG